MAATAAACAATAQRPRAKRWSPARSAETAGSPSAAAVSAIEARHKTFDDRRPDLVVAALDVGDCAVGCEHSPVAAGMTAYYADLIDDDAKLEAAVAELEIADDAKAAFVSHAKSDRARINYETVCQTAGAKTNVDCIPSIQVPVSEAKYFAGTASPTPDGPARGRARNRHGEENGHHLPDAENRRDESGPRGVWPRGVVKG